MQVWTPYCGAAPVPAEWLARWNLDPAVLAGLVLCGGWLTLRAVAGRERNAAVLAIGLLVILFVSPFCALSSALFSARVAHHLALAAIAAPLFAISLPRLALPGGATGWAALHALTFWAWHTPQAYAIALSSDAMYWLMQLSLLASALGMWSAVLRGPALLGIGALLASMVQMGLLGALISFASRPLYAPHWLTTQAWGLASLEDQQLAGLLMWVAGSGIYLGAAMWIGLRWKALAALRA